MAPGIHIQPLRLDPEKGQVVLIATMAPGCPLPIHYQTAGAPGVRQIRPALHHGFATGAVQQGVAHNRQAVVAEQVPVRPARRCTRNPQRQDVASLSRASVGTDPANRRQRGLKTAMTTVRQWRRRNGLRR